FFLDKVSWDYNVNESLIGNFFSYVNVFANCSCIAIQCYYNTKSFIWLKTTQQRLVTQDQKRIRDREKKLFIQCFVTCCLYATVVLMFIVLNHRVLLAGDESLSIYVLFNLMWILHHSLNAIVYLILNK
uniref:7TM GPCR serpentine receptor class x (Srx) domain-containing protein n=1 Tax=Romanomermis culicivorax TaxID=13658 RepID=A0A915JAJ8_ROMCU